MKLGIISDIHSNIYSLEIAFEKFKELEVENIICLGDVIGIGPSPEKCIDFLMSKESSISSFVKGNHENYLLNGIPKRNHNQEDGRLLTDEEINTHVWNHSRLNDKQVEFIKKIKNKDIIKVQGRKIVIEHYPMDNNNIYKKYCKFLNAEKLIELFEEKDADIYLFGHTHKQFYEEINSKYFINPGSLGCPINTEGASFGILELENDLIDYKQFNIKYDIEKVVNDIKKHNYPLNEFMIKTFY